MPVDLSPFFEAADEALASRGLSLSETGLDTFLGAQERWQYKPFEGFRQKPGVLPLIVQHDGEVIATYGAIPYTLPLSLRDEFQRRKLYETEESWELTGNAAWLAEQVSDMAVFEGACVVREDWRGRPESGFLVGFLPLYTRALVVQRWSAPWVFFMVKGGRKLGPRFKAERLEGDVIWRDGEGNVKDDVTRLLGVTSAARAVADAARFAAGPH